MTHSEDFLEEVKKDWSKFHIKVTYNAEGLLDRPQIRTAEQAADLFLSVWDLDLISIQEQFVALFFNSQHRLLGFRLISTGSVGSIVVNLKLIAGIALHTVAQHVMVCHNHPSGSIEPSFSDKNLTIQMQSMLKLIDSKLTDHIILSPTGDHFSFAESGLL